ncbi:glycosyl hydrolase family 18 protein [Pseudonocardia hispaniensis]|uniref:Glycosyl hydrolase family 18 protein n=1 Tax=Pseudonocardia hispaniensis TaxID=904933 RepID=A0ABW1J247_9PSEU
MGRTSIPGQAAAAAVRPLPTTRQPRRGRRPRWRGGLWLIILCLGAIVIILVALLRPTARPPMLAVAALPYWNLTGGSGVVLANRQDFNEVSPWMYGLARDGSIVVQYPPAESARLNASLRELRTAGMPIVPTLANVTNGSFSYEPVAAILHDPAVMARHIADITDLVRHGDYAGIDIDYENLRAGDRDAFTTFVTRLADALHAHGKTLSVAVFAKSTDAGYDERNVAQDYAAIGAVADEVRLMAYDYHWSTSPPGPVAPIGWVRDVLAYATTQIPADKLLLGVSLSGYDWANGRGETVSWLQCFGRARQYQVPVAYDVTAQAPWFRYVDSTGRAHEVWFENAESATAKFAAARGAGIRGVFLWMFGAEDERVWSALHEALPVQPLDDGGEGAHR